MFSIYTSGFNLVRNKFAFEAALADFDDFADEVVIAVNTSDDGTEQEVEKLQAAFALNGGNLKIVKTDFSYQDPAMDGKIKNAALQATTEYFKIGLDLDESIPLWQKPIWENMAETLNSYPTAGSVMIPVVNLYKDRNTLKDIGTKWYLHKPGMYRGVVDFARHEGKETFDITQSDSCELISKDGQLVQAMVALPAMPPPEYLIKILETGQYPFVVHWGYINLETRVERNLFWKDHWSLRAGREVDTPTTIAELEKFPSFPHNLKIE